MGRGGKKISLQNNWNKNSRLRQGNNSPLAAQESALEAVAAEIEQSLHRPFTYDIPSGSDLFDENFSMVFAYKIIEYENATGGERLNKKPFEAALAQAWNFMPQYKADLTRSETHPGEDVTVSADKDSSQKKVSCKTEGGKSIRKSTVTVSKLQELAGIRNIQTKEDAAAYLPRIVQQANVSDATFVLRCFDEEDEGSSTRRYDLVEIPKKIFRELKKLKPEDFSDIKPNGGTSASVKKGDEEICRIIYDGSDEKVSLRVSLKSCILHCSWIFPDEGSPASKD